MLIFQEPSKKKRLELPEKEKRQREQVDKILQIFLYSLIVILIKYLVVWCVRICSSLIFQFLNMFNPYTLQISLPKADEMRRLEKERVKYV